MEKKCFSLYCFDSSSCRIVELKSVSVPPPARIRLPPPFVVSVVQCVVYFADVTLISAKYILIIHSDIVWSWRDDVNYVVLLWPLCRAFFLDWQSWIDWFWENPFGVAPAAISLSWKSLGLTLSWNMGSFADNVAGCNLCVSYPSSARMAIFHILVECSWGLIVLSENPRLIGGIFFLHCTFCHAI